MKPLRHTYKFANAVESNDELIHTMFIPFEDKFAIRIVTAKNHLMEWSVYTLDAEWIDFWHSDVLSIEQKLKIAKIVSSFQNFAGLKSIH